MNLFDFEFYTPVYLGIFINLIVIFLLAYQGVIAFFIHRKTNFDYAKPLLYLCVCSIIYSFSIVYAYFGILRDYMYELSHATIFLGVFTNTVYLNTLRKYTKAPKIFKYYEYILIGFSFLCLVAFWQSIISNSDTIIYNFGPSPRSPYVDLIARYNGLPNHFSSILFGFIGVSGAFFSMHLLYHVFQTSRDKWIIVGVSLNLILAIHDVAFMIFLLFYTFPLMSLSFVVEIMRMTFQMQNASAKKVGKLEDEVNYLTQVARAGFAVGQICHDIRNPLSVIEGHNQLMLHHIDNPDRPKEKILRSVDKIAVSSQRIAVILDNYLGEIYHTSDPKYAEISLKKILEDAIELCSEKTKATGISRIIYECSDSEFVYGVENQLVMAFVNLLSNSCDAIEALEDRWISIKSLQEETSDFVIRVIDSGSGISRHLESSIFERSFTTKEKGKGTGLGLSFVKKVIEAHQGKIFVDHSCENTCFVIILPDKKTTATRKLAV